MDKVVLQSLASDLKRITLSIQRNSLPTARRFNLEAEKWLQESKRSADPSLEKLLGKVALSLKQENNLDKAEDLLMYSTLLQNRS
jgi:hypothetical protein